MATGSVWCGSLSIASCQILRLQCCILFTRMHGLTKSSQHLFIRAGIGRPFVTRLAAQKSRARSRYPGIHSSGCSSLGMEASCLFVLELEDAHVVGALEGVLLISWPTPCVARCSGCRHHQVSRPGTILGLAVSRRSCAEAREIFHLSTSTVALAPSESLKLPPVAILLMGGAAAQVFEKRLCNDMHRNKLAQQVGGCAGDQPPAAI